MKNKITYILIILTIPFIHTNAQVEQITLDECQQLARENYPLIKQYNLISITEKYNAENVAKNYLPQITLNAQASYQSAVTKLPIDFSSLPIPGANLSTPNMSKDQYKATVDVSQIIWDGGIINAQQKIIKTNSEVEKQNLEVNLFTIKDRIIQFYFGILSIDKQLEILRLHRENLQSTINFVNSALKNGIAMQSDADAISVELLKLDQKEIELTNLRSSTMQLLATFINKPIDNSTKLIYPEEYYIKETNKRPELALFDSQRALLNAQENAISAKNMPQLGLFLQGGYGRPGLDMLENKFKPFAIGGVKFTWKFGNLYTKRNEKQLIENNRNMLLIQEETFRFNTNLQSTQAHAEIIKFKELIKKDDEIISLRNRLRIAAEAKYKNGVYTINDLIKDINAENESLQTKALHHIQHLLSTYNHKNINGN